VIIVKVRLVMVGRRGSTCVKVVSIRELLWRRWVMLERVVVELDPTCEEI